MFLQTKAAAAAAFIVMSISPASAAIVDVYATATLTEVLRSGFFGTGFDPSDYTFTSPELEAETFGIFSDAEVGDTINIHWQMSTEDSNGWDQDPEDKSEDMRYGYPGGPISDTTFTSKGSSWHIGSSEGSTVNYTDKPGEFRLTYSSSDNAENYLGGYPSYAYHKTLIDKRPESYVTSKGLMNIFQYSGDNLGDGNLDIYSEMMTVTDKDEAFYDETVFSALKLNYRVTSLETSLRTPEIAAVPLPSGMLLMASGLLGFRLLRSRKA